MANNKLIPTYSHKEGHDDHPRHFYKDERGNLVRYTNGPEGHKDSVSHYSKPSIHPGEPDFAKNPEFFTPDGRKISRAPLPEAQIEWNPSYHPTDNKNLWVGRWVHPESGNHEYSYLDSDIRNNASMYIHQQNAVVDTRLSFLRQFIKSLLDSDQIKDKVVAAALILLDQGRFRLTELAALTPIDVNLSKQFIKMDNKIIYADYKLISIIEYLYRSIPPNFPLFTVPVMEEAGPHPVLRRLVGPHYLTRVLDYLGVTPEALQTYHASQTYSREMQFQLLDKQLPFPLARQQALMSVAQEMGYQLGQYLNDDQALVMIEQVFIDPILVNIFSSNASTYQGTAQPQPQPPQVLQVSSDLITRTPDEEQFSQWLHSTPAHEFLPNG